MKHRLPRLLSESWFGLLALLVAACGPPGAYGDTVAPKEPGVTFPVIARFENFGNEQGMPAHKVHAVLKASDGRLWVGTWNGLLVRQDAGFRRFGPEDGLSHKMVLCLAEDTTTGDLWVGTMRGLNRVSGGRITTFTQTTSGLPNNIVYGVDVVGNTVWAATAAGAGALDLQSGVWRLYDHNNTLMHEPWCYAVKGAKTKVYLGVWGGGILEHDLKTESFKEYRDPDRDFHYILVADAGPLNDITSWLTWEDGLLWQGTYFGVSRYDGARWRNWVEKRSPLLSNFVNFIWAHRRVAWIGTDRGVSVTDGETWVNYLVGEKGEGLVELHRPGQAAEQRTLATSLPNGFVLGIYVDDDEAWLATSKGLSRGVFAPYPRPATVAEVK